MNTSLISAGSVYKKAAAAMAIAALLAASIPAYAQEAPPEEAQRPTVSLSISDEPIDESGDFPTFLVTAELSAMSDDFSASDIVKSSVEDSVILDTFEQTGDTTYTFSMKLNGSVGCVKVDADAFHDADGLGNEGTGDVCQNADSDGDGDSSNDPVIVITEGPEEGEAINSTTTTFGFTTTAPTTCQFGSGSFFPCYDAASSTQLVTLGTDSPSGLGESDYTFVIKAQDEDGSTTTTRNFSVDLTAPVITLESIDTNDDGIPESITFHTDEDGMPEVSGGCVLEEDDEVLEGTSTLAFAELEDEDTYNCSFVIVDAAGNESNAIEIPEFNVEDNNSGGGGGGGSRRSTPVFTGENTSSNDSNLNNFPAVITPAPDTSGGFGGSGDGTSGGPVVVGGSALAPGEVLGEETAATGTDSGISGEGTTVGAGAAAAGSGASIPPWAWFLLALILLAALLYWAYRRSVAYEGTR